MPSTFFRISQEELAKLAQISVSTVRRFARGDKVSEYPRWKIQAALDSKGVVIVAAERQLELAEKGR
jgi:transcriptional regulator with XRE-family HTH domain